ncbi:MAG: exodeoxyribonuclease III [Ignavibacteria bacterium]|nr:exodeoxyribonuclease III [Ignavibacteria bacterium]
MKTLRIFSWNVSGFRAVLKKGFMDWFKKTSPDIVCLQEVKATKEQLNSDAEIEGYEFYLNPAERKGYSGVAIYTKEKPLSVNYGFNHSSFDNEGRVIEADYGSFLLYNVYFPNGGEGNRRVPYKLAFYDEFFFYVEKKRKKQKNIIIGGDFNTAHTELDLARPKENEGNTGLLPEERQWIDRLINLGYVDTFRIFNSEGGHYTYWDYFTRARVRNVGWRIDYFFVTKEMKDKVISCKIHSEVHGSDHCPVELEIKI